MIFMYEIITLLVSFAVAFLMYRWVHWYYSNKVVFTDYDKQIAELLSKRDQEGQATVEHREKFSMFTDAERDDIELSLMFHSGYFDKLRHSLHKPGVNMSLTQFFIYVVILSFLIVCGLFYTKFCRAIVALPLGCILGYVIVLSFVNHRIASYKTEFIKAFPEAIEMMIRGVKAGLDITRVIKLVAAEAKPPIADEFANISRRLDLGVSTDRVFAEKADELDIEEFRFLSVALILQIENGGQLAEILNNLIVLIRKRLELALKVRALSAEARLSAIVISALPFVFAFIMYFLNPSHVAELFKPGTGQTLLKVFCILFVSGIVCMSKVARVQV